MDSNSPDLNAAPTHSSILLVLTDLLKHHWRKVAPVSIIFLLLCWFVSLLAGIAFLIFIFGRTVYNATDKLLYYPLTPPHSRIYVPLPSTVGLSYEIVNVKCKDKTKLHGFLILQPEEKRSTAPTLLFFHGNAGNIGHRLPNCKLLYQLGINILLLEWRGYGLSEGKPSENGFYKDAVAGLDYLLSRDDLNRRRIIVFGRSLGGAVAVDIASRTEYRDKIACVIVENSFTSISDMAKTLIPVKLVQKLPEIFYKSQFNSRTKVQRVRCPAIFISGLQDELVPSEMMFELHERCGSEFKRLLTIPNGTHNGTWTCSGYYGQLAQLLEEAFLVYDERNPPDLTKSAIIQII